MKKIFATLVMALTIVSAFASEMEARSIAEKFLKEVEGQVKVGGMHVTYDDLTPKYIKGIFNLKKIWGPRESWVEFAGRCKGTPTIGYGTTNPKIVKKHYITEEEALTALRADIRYVYAKLVWKYEPYFERLNSNQQAALVSYHYNCGFGRHPKLYKLLETDPANAWKEMDAKGSKSRRDKEHQLYRGEIK